MTIIKLILRFILSILMILMACLAFPITLIMLTFLAFIGICGIFQIVFGFVCSDENQIEDGKDALFFGCLYGICRPFIFLYNFTIYGQLKEHHENI